MRRFELCGFAAALMVVLVASTVPAQTRRAADRTAPAVASSVPVVRVTTQNPREINLGKPATFVIGVSNEGKTPAAEVVVSARIPEHVELAKTDPRPISIEGGIYKFRVGDLPPGAKRTVTVVAIPRQVSPIALNATVVFGTATVSETIVRRPMLRVNAEVSPQVVIKSEVDWTVSVTNTGDGPADNVIVTPSLLAGKLQGTPLQQPVKIGPLKPGETKEVQFSVVPTQKGEVKAKFVTTNPDGLEASQESAFRVLQAELAVTWEGPRMQPLGRGGKYVVRVTNPGDAPSGLATVRIKIPEGLEFTAAADRKAFNEEHGTLRWRITNVRPGVVVPLWFEAESTSDGQQLLTVTAESERVAEVTAKHTTHVISRPNLVVTVLNDQELSEIGDPISFRVTVVNAGSRLAENLRVRVALPEGLEPVDSDAYNVAGREIEFPTQKLASGEKTTLNFRAIGRQLGEHRVRVLLDGTSLATALAIEASAFCYSDQEVPTTRRNPAAASGVR